MTRASWSVCFLALTVAWICGCGDGRPRRVPVSGQILIDGEPLAAGTDGFIRIEPAEGRAATGKIDPTDGTFTLSTYDPNDGCIEGTHRVAVVVNATVAGGLVPLIPEHYGTAETSGLSVTIDGPTDSLKIELQGPLRPVPADAGTGQGDDPGPI
jgi:hypothetical protein